MIVFIPIKQNSQRVPRKNFRDFGGIELYKHTLYKYVNHEVYVDTDSEEIIYQINSDVKLNNVKIIHRKKELIGDKVSVCDLISSFVEENKISDPIVQIHVTSPFLKEETVVDAYKEIKKYDSVVSCNKLHTRLWRKEKYGYCPVNHNPMKLQQTQDLPAMYEENSAFYIFNPEVILGHNNRIGENPCFYPLNYPENVDIDTEKDMDLALQTLLGSRNE